MDWDEADHFLESDTTVDGWNEEAPIVESAQTPIKAPQRIGFFNLPAELRNTIYDFTIDDLRSLPRKSYRKLPLAQVSRQFRSEYLARYYRLPLRFDFILFIDTDQIRDPEAYGMGNVLRKHPKKWLSIFGETRVPLMRRLYIQGSAFSVRISLSSVSQPSVVEVASAYVTRRWASFAYVDKPAIETEIRQFLAGFATKEDDGSEYITRSVMVDLLDRIKAHERRLCEAAERTAT